MTDLSLVWLFLAAIPVGMFAIIIGGAAVLSFAVFQTLFPGMALAAIVGNTELGSVLRNGSSLISLRKDVDYKRISSLLLALGTGAIIGALLIVDVTQIMIVPILALGFLVMEFSDRIARLITGRTYIVMTFLVGIYGGMFGAGVSLLLVSLIRIKYSVDADIYKTRADAIFLEISFAVLALMVFIYYGLIILPIALTWAAGAIIGGYLGGVLLKRTGRLSGSAQKNILRGAFAFAIGEAVWHVIRNPP